LSTLSGKKKQSSEPESPDAAMTVWPCRAMRSKMAFSLAKYGGSVDWIANSQLPQLVVTVEALSSLAIRLYMSNACASVPLGAS